MSATSTSFRHAVVFASTLFALLLVISCGKKAAPPVNTEQEKQPPPSAPPVSSPDEPPEPPGGIAFPPGFGRRTKKRDKTRCHIVWALSQVTVPKQSQP